MRRHSQERRPARQQEEGAERRHEEGERAPGHRWRDCRLASRLGHHLRGRRFSGGESGGQRVATGKRRRDGECRGGSAQRVRLQAAEDDALHRRIEVVHEARRGRRRRLRSQASQLVERRRSERRLPGEELVEHQTERVEVAAGRDFPSRELFRRHVGRCARRDVGAFDLLREAGEAEVGDARPAAAVHHDVRRLQVAVEHADLVRRRKAGADLPCDLDRLVLREMPDAPQQRRQVLAVDVFHRQEVMPVGFARVVDPADVRVRDLARGAHLCEEALQAVRARLDARRQEL